MVTPAGYPQRWTTSLFTPGVDPPLSMPGSFDPGRYPASGPPQQVGTGFVPLAAGFNPTLSTDRMPAPYSSPPLLLATSPPQHQPGFAPPISPYMDSRTINRPPIAEPSTPRDARRTNYPESPVRLPPIFPAASTPRGPLGHRLSDPYPTLWTLRDGEEPPEDRRPRPPSQGQIEPLSHHVQFHPPVSMAALSEPLPPQSAPVAAPTERRPADTPATRPREEQAGTEAEASKPRPAKRRKMALDDMVND